MDQINYIGVRSMKSLNKLTRTMNKVNSKAKDVKVLASGDPGKIAKRAKNKFLWRMMNKLFRKFM